MKVTLIGAGPGDFELMTIKGVNRLKSADVILYDRLIDENIMSLMPENAEKINVGKNAKDHPIPQDEINKLLLEKAQQGLNVVRLKGGDPFVFGRGGEELEVLLKNDIPFEVIPGVSSAIAAGAYAGIPITHRNYASSFHIITGHAKDNNALDIDFEALVRTKGTLIFMMSVFTIGKICRGCLTSGMEKDMPAAIVENVASSSQRKFIGTVETLPDIAKKNNIASPAIIIIGKVCSLSDKLDWFSKKPLLHKNIIVTRTRSSESSLVMRLRELGCNVIEMPTISILPLVNENQKLKDALMSIKSYKWLIFTSGIGVNLFFDYLIENQYDIRKLHHIKIGAVGSETKREVLKRGVIVDYVPEEYNGAALAKGLIPHIKEGEKLLLLRARIGSEDILDIFKESKISFENISIYDTIYEKKNSSKLEKMIDKGEIDYITFTSSSTVEGFVKAVSSVDLKKLKGICIGKKTAETAKSYGIQTFVSEKATIDSMIQKIKEINL